ncbi:unnamed protein product [Allacma fusca]|uniref:Uncharacterized protein n=1 Tax=Allacma fusca TaxID=39272 RepID=A0A8J2LIA2_9HEXA|nr:unnamed protein product [Allacma fusca]
MNFMASCFTAMFFLPVILSLSNTVPESETIPQNKNPLFCNFCKNCLDPRPVRTHFERRDNSWTSYCFTRQFMDKGLPSIERGAIRPKPEDFKDNLHPACPAETFGKKKTQWCFCEGHDCNDIPMRFDGLVEIVDIESDT